VLCLRRERKRNTFRKKTELDGLVFGELEGLQTPSWLRQRFERSGPDGVAGCMGGRVTTHNQSLCWRDAEETWHGVGGRAKICSTSLQ
jgi:hypothetical protein